MFQIRRADDRGHADHGWLNSHHTFSFAGYYDPEHMGFGPLRVINEDRVQPGRGFGTHPHQDMEIISYVLDGALEHKDTMGNSSVIRPGDVQFMSAGTGVMHSEYNHSDRNLVHFLQIWVMPNARGGEPRYGQRHYTKEERLDQLRLVASPDGRDDTLQVKQDMFMYAGVFSDNASAEHELARGRRVWLHVAKGSIRVGESTLHAGDALASTDAGPLRLTSQGDSEIILFDLP